MNLPNLAIKGIMLGKKYAPELLVATGVVSMLSSTVLAIKATPKALEVIDKHYDTIEKIELCKNGGVNVGEYTTEDYRKDKIITFTNTTVDMMKTYAWPIATATIGVASIMSGFGILRARNIALVGALNSVTTQFKKYRKEVIDKYGKEIDREMRNGTILTKAEEIDGATGEVTDKDILNPNDKSMYARFFDEGNIHWSKQQGYNFMFLKGQEQYANDLLRSRQPGIVLLNEVYDMLGIPRTPAGAQVGWHVDDGDGYIDFGMFDVANEKARDFVNGHERSILLDFNVDGVVYDKL